MASAPRSGIRWPGQVLLVGLIGAICLLCGMLGVRPAWAQGEMNPRLRIEQLFADARQAYEDLELETARNSLRTALRVAGTQGVEGPIVAKLHMMLGVVLHAETKQDQQTEEEFLAALALDPQLRLDPSLASNTLETIYQRAKARAAANVAPAVPLPAGPPGPGAGTELPPAPPGRPVLAHKRVTRAYERVNIPIFVEIQGTTAPQRILLRYRRPGGPWNEVELMPQAGDSASGYVPAHAVVGDWIEYYIEATDWAGRALAQVGSSIAPFRVSVVQSGVPGMAGTTPPPLTEPPASTSRIIHLLFGVGTGVGIAKAPPERRPDVLIDEGFAATVMHVYNELGIYPTDRFMILFATRLQLIFEDGQSMPSVTPLLSLRGRWIVSNSSPVRAFVGAGGGYCAFLGGDCGSVRHSVNLQPVDDFTDTTLEGNIHAGAEGGLIFDITPHVGLEFDLFAYALFGEKSSFQTDLNAGLTFSF